MEPVPVPDVSADGSIRAAVAPNPLDLESELDELLDTVDRGRRATSRGVAPAARSEAVREAGAEPAVAEAEPLPASVADSNTPSAGTGAPAERDLSPAHAHRAELVGDAEAPPSFRSVPARSRVLDEPIHRMPDARRSAATLKLFATLVVLVLAGFVLWRAVRPELVARPTDADVPRSPVLQGAQVSAAPTAESKTAAPATTEPPAPVADLSFGRVLPFIDQGGDVSVAEGEGLLVIEYESGESPPEVQVGGRDLGPAPVRIPLPPGRHELVLKRGARSSFRYLVIRAGETRIVDVE